MGRTLVPSESRERPAKHLLIYNNGFDFKCVNEPLNDDYVALKRMVTSLSNAITFSYSVEVRFNVDLLRDVLKYGKDNSFRVLK